MLLKQLEILNATGVETLSPKMGNVAPQYDFLRGYQRFRVQRFRGWGSLQVRTMDFRLPDAY